MKRAGMVLMLGALLLCGACSESKPAAAPAADAGATSMADAAKAAVAATNANTAATTSAVVADGKPVNLLCPILGDPVTKQGGTVSFQGHTVGFCCGKCSSKFMMLDDKGKLAALANHGTVLK